MKGSNIKGGTAAGTNPSTTDAVVALLEAHPYKVASTMPEIPHSYTLRRLWESDADFVAVVLFIRANGVRKKFGKRYYTYLIANGYEWWTMGERIERTILINRAEVKPAGGVSEPIACEGPT